MRKQRQKRRRRLSVEGEDAPLNVVFVQPDVRLAIAREVARELGRAAARKAFDDWKTQANDSVIRGDPE